MITLSCILSCRDGFLCTGYVAVFMHVYVICRMGKYASCIYNLYFLSYHLNLLIQFPSISYPTSEVPQKMANFPHVSEETSLFFRETFFRGFQVLQPDSQLLTRYQL